MTDLIETKEAEVLDDVDGRYTSGCDDFPGHLQTNLDNLQRVGEDHLTAPSLSTKAPGEAQVRLK